MRKRGFAAVCAVLLATTPAQSACWSANAMSAARIRDLQTFLMVETLRCQVMGFDLTSEYNGFLRANRTTLGAVNGHLKSFFIAADGPVFGQQSYDRFTTTLANAYGASHTSADTCADARDTAHEAAMMDNDEQGLLMIADRQGLMPRLPGGVCGRETMAEASRH